MSRVTITFKSLLLLFGVLLSGALLLWIPQFAAAEDEIDEDVAQTYIDAAKDALLDLDNRPDYNKAYSTIDPVIASAEGYLDDDDLAMAIERAEVASALAVDWADCPAGEITVLESFPPQISCTTSDSANVNALQTLIESLMETLSLLLSQAGIDTDLDEFIETGGSNAGVVQSDFVCTTVFDRRLEVGSRGADVTALQILLNQDPDTQLIDETGEPLSATGYYGDITVAALARYHAKYMPNVALADRGNFGPQTRQHLNQLCDANVDASSKNLEVTERFDLEVIFEQAYTAVGLSGSLILFEDFFTDVSGKSGFDIDVEKVNGADANNYFRTSSLGTLRSDGAPRGGYLIKVEYRGQTKYFGLNIGGDYITDLELVRYDEREQTGSVSRDIVAGSYESIPADVPESQIVSWSLGVSGRAAIAQKGVPGSPYTWWKYDYELSAVDPEADFEFKNGTLTTDGSVSRGIYKLTIHATPNATHATYPTDEEFYDIWVNIGSVGVESGAKRRCYIDPTNIAAGCQAITDELVTTDFNAGGGPTNALTIYRNNSRVAGFGLMTRSAANSSCQNKVDAYDADDTIRCDWGNTTIYEGAGSGAVSAANDSNNETSAVTTGTLKFYVDGYQQSSFNSLTRTEAENKCESEASVISSDQAVSCDWSGIQIFSRESTVSSHTFTLDAITVGAGGSSVTLDLSATPVCSGGQSILAYGGGESDYQGFVGTFGNCDNWTVQAPADQAAGSYTLKVEVTTLAGDMYLMQVPITVEGVPTCDSLRDSQRKSVWYKTSAEFDALSSDEARLAWARQFVGLNYSRFWELNTPVAYPDDYSETELAEYDSLVSSLLTTKDFEASMDTFVNDVRATCLD